MTKFIEFKSLAEALKAPEFLIWDFAKFDGSDQLHRLWQALYKFEQKVFNNIFYINTFNFLKYKRSPKPRNKKDADLLKAELEGTGTVQISDELLLNFSYQVLILNLNISII